MNSPAVVFLVFKRPEATRESFAAIREARPERLFVVADGPRAHVPDDAEKCRQVREIATAVDWPCRVETDFAGANLGLKRRVSSGISWAFSQVEEAVIVEDDCVLDPSFFRFAAETLERHRDDERILCVSANNLQRGRKRTADSYYFSRYPHCWGWASWRRAWRHFDPALALWPELRDGGWLRDILHDPAEEAYWTRNFDLCHEGKIDSWAFPWTYSCWVRGGLTILPAENLVRNVGFGEEGTHARTTEHPASALKEESLSFPLRHPRWMIRDAEADAFTFRKHFSWVPRPPRPSLAARVRRRLGL